MFSEVFLLKFQFMEDIIHVLCEPPVVIFGAEHPVQGVYRQNEHDHGHEPKDPIGAPGVERKELKKFEIKLFAAINYIRPRMAITLEPKSR